MNLLNMGIGNLLLKRSSSDSRTVPHKLGDRFLTPPPLPLLDVATKRWRWWEHGYGDVWCFFSRERCWIEGVQAGISFLHTEDKRANQAIETCHRTRGRKESSVSRLKSCDALYSMFGRGDVAICGWLVRRQAGPERQGITPSSRKF